MFEKACCILSDYKRVVVSIVQRWCGDVENMAGENFFFCFCIKHHFRAQNKFHTEPKCKCYGAIWHVCPGNNNTTLKSKLVSSTQWQKVKLCVLQYACRNVEYLENNWVHVFKSKCRLLCILILPINLAIIANDLILTILNVHPAQKPLKAQVNKRD